MMPPEAITGTLTASTYLWHEGHRADHRSIEARTERASVRSGLCALGDDGFHACSLQSNRLVHRRGGSHDEQAALAELLDRIGREQAEREAEHRGIGVEHSFELFGKVDPTGGGNGRGRDAKLHVNVLQHLDNAVCITGRLGRRRGCEQVDAEWSIRSRSDLGRCLADCVG
jgi:hypothetical protein